MRNLLVAALAALAVVYPAAAANTRGSEAVSASLLAVEDTAELVIHRQDATAAIQLSGTWAGVVTFEGTQDGSTWIQIPGYNVSATLGAKVTLAAANGNFAFPVMQWRSVRARFSTRTSGTVVVTMTASAVPFVFSWDTTMTPWVNIRALGGATTAGVPGGGAPTGAIMIGGFAEDDGAPLNASHSDGVVEGDEAYLKTSRTGRLFVDPSHPNRVQCALTTTATTSTLITGCSAPGAGTRIRITDIAVFGGVATGATAAVTIQSGTGGSCGTGTTILEYCQHAATSGCTFNYTSPRVAGDNHEVCLLDATTGTKFITIRGFIE